MIGKSLKTIILEVNQELFSLEKNDIVQYIEQRQLDTSKMSSWSYEDHREFLLESFFRRSIHDQFYIDFKENIHRLDDIDILKMFKIHHDELIKIFT